MKYLFDGGTFLENAYLFGSRHRGSLDTILFFKYFSWFTTDKIDSPLIKLQLPLPKSRIEKTDGYPI